MLRSCQSTRSELEQPHFTYARAAGSCHWLPARSRIISMQLSMSTCWRISTKRGYSKLPPTSKVKTLNPALRAERATGSPMFPLPKAAADAERYAFPLAKAKTTRLAVQYPLARERKMATKSSAAADEAQIRQRVESWTTALRAKDLEWLMSHTHRTSWARLVHLLAYTFALPWVRTLA